MNWKEYRDAINACGTVSFRPKGRSMEPKINSGQLVYVIKINPSFLKVDDIVFCKVDGTYYVHFIKEIKYSDRYYFKIGNNKDRINGWTPENKIFGKVIDIRD